MVHVYCYLLRPTNQYEELYPEQTVSSVYFAENQERIEQKNSVSFTEQSSLNCNKNMLINKDDSNDRFSYINSSQLV